MLFSCFKCWFEVVHQASNDIDLDLIGLMKLQAEKQSGDDVDYTSQISEGTLKVACA